MFEVAKDGLKRVSEDSLVTEGVRERQDLQRMKRG
jgi:hypothetical protein